LVQENLTLLWQRGGKDGSACPFYALA